MSLSAYTKRNWANGPGGGTPLSASNLDAMDQQIKDLTDTALPLPDQNGWMPLTGVTFSYSSADGHTFVCGVTSDMRGNLPLGARIKLTQSGVVNYFIVTAVSATTVTLYGGTDYTVANVAISAPYWSVAKAPFGFPLDPNKWTESFVDTASRAQGSPTSATWYNLGGLALAIPIGVWEVSWSASIYVDYSSATPMDIAATFSTTNNGESDTQFSVHAEFTSVTAYGLPATRTKRLVLAAKTIYYLNAKTNQAISSIRFLGNAQPTVARAVCAYL